MFLKITFLLCVLIPCIRNLKFICFQGLSYNDVKIKWPNDLYLNGLKIGGILCTSTYRSRKFLVSVGNKHYSLEVCNKYLLEVALLLVLLKLVFLLAGVGLNVDNEQPTTCLNAVLKDVCPPSNLLKREEILGAFFKKFENFFDLFMEQGNVIFIFITF